MTELIIRVKEATEGSRELSDEILLALGWTTKTVIDPGASADYGEDIEAKEWISPSGENTGYLRPRCTESLGDALYLVPETWYWRVQGGGDATNLAALMPPGNDLAGYAQGATSSLAVCVALLEWNDTLDGKLYD